MKAYKLHISQHDLPIGIYNTREITVSFVTLVVELHRIIQALYGLKDYHAWRFSDKENFSKSIRHSLPDEMIDEELLALVEKNKKVRTMCSAYNTLLGQFISRKPKTIYYTYDFGGDSTRKIEYKGLTTLPDKVQWQCDNYKGFWCIEDLAIWEQIDLMNIYTSGDKKTLQQKYDYRKTWKDFEHYMKPVFAPIDVKILNQKLEMVKQYSMFNLKNSKKNI